MKKLLSLILAVLIVITSFGLTAFAEDVVTENKTESGSEITTDIEENNEAENNETEKEPVDDIEQKPATYSDKVKKYANSGLEYIVTGLGTVVYSPALLLGGVIPGFGFIFILGFIAALPYGLGRSLYGLGKVALSPIIAIF